MHLHKNETMNVLNTSFQFDDDEDSEENLIPTVQIVIQNKNLQGKNVYIDEFSKEKTEYLLKLVKAQSGTTVSHHSNADIIVTSNKKNKFSNAVHPDYLGKNVCTMLMISHLTF